MEVLIVEGLSKNFGGVQALCNVSFNVKEGERLAIIGPNGAGKTTLFNLLSGRLPVTAGRIYSFGNDITNMAEHQHIHFGLARSFQVSSLFPELTVLENVLLAIQGTKPYRFQVFRRIFGYTELFAKAQELLEAMDLWEKRDQIVQDIAYGEQRKLEIALSIASEPKVLLLDEPSSGLTAAETAGIIDMIHSMGSNFTVLLFAHEMDLVFGLAERIIVLHYGKIIVEGTPDKIQADSRVKEIYMGIEEGMGNAGVI